ncbi:hypothetical protein ACN38_g12969, partial [Penicillium nordicum]
RPLPGCEWHEACLGGNRCRLPGAEALLCTAAETDCTGLGAPVVRQEPNQRIFKLGRGSVLISFDINFWNLYNRDSSLLSEEFSEDICFQGSFLWFHILLFRSSILSFNYCWVHGCLRQMASNETDPHVVDSFSLSSLFLFSVHPLLDESYRVPTVLFLHP